MPISEQQGAWLGALITAAPGIVMQIIEYLRSRGHDAAADDLSIKFASAKASYLTVINISREERGLPPLTPADLADPTP